MVAKTSPNELSSRTLTRTYVHNRSLVAMADKLSQLETDVELHKRIVAAAERLAKDKSMNKSVRKKRQKDFHAAAMKLRGLELGLNQMRLSASKPDVSSMESNGSGARLLGDHCINVFRKRQRPVTVRLACHQELILVAVPQHDP
ncbi:hypothetical protein TELCIR_02667 [Teladorsagia circumcincta]|uniref:Uncharacterized protein n=1 Tax=Teladorsagia circumcincta TaxID=45464 RepID=A0A2G9UYJ2_TELCI|nr:hypothetical protein TELCIR_02667 [Teladorsagia circumcincta]